MIKNGTLRMKMDLITNHYRVCDLVLFFLSFKSSGDFWRESYNWWCIPASTIWIELVGIPLHCHSSDLSNFPFVLLPILESFRCLSTLSLSLSLSLSHNWNHSVWLMIWENVGYLYTLLHYGEKWQQGCVSVKLLYNC